MKVEILKATSYAIRGIKIVHFDEGEILAVGDKGLDEKSIKRLVEIDLARVYEQEAKEAPKKAESVEQVGEKEEEGEKEDQDYRNIEDKDELEAFAKEKFGIELDKRRSLRNMFKDLETKIKG